MDRFSCLGIFNVDFVWVAVYRCVFTFCGLMNILQLPSMNTLKQKETEPFARSLLNVIAKGYPPKILRSMNAANSTSKTTTPTAMYNWFLLAPPSASTWLALG